MVSDNDSVFFQERDSGASSSFSRFSVDYCHDAHPGLTYAHDLFCIGERAAAEHIDEQIMHELLIAARVGDERFCLGFLGRVNEPRATSPRTQRRIDQVPHPRARLVIKHERPPKGTLGITPQPK